ncbi:alanine racemase [Agromyces atrinae]|uniref:Alanine racemase n=1 Tax=Agromyces atrinae TaxID=592376 RepID=A0A4Q2MBP1_9MICO|nr:alanine racemase [Agromyces atrinae]NYD66842.1 alanine racemase [Agromyces atrinae]RXZ87491.1 alanine racemase [Agromyces atrinae]
MTAPRREASVDLDAIRRNVAELRRRAGSTSAMAVVKANGYGHGAVAVARAALEGGASRLGVADLDEALALREAGISAPILAWLHDGESEFRTAIASDIEIGVSSLDQLDRVAADAVHAGDARVHIKLDTGLSRNGVAESEWRRLFDRARELADDGRVRVAGVFSHLANASDESDADQVAAFERGLGVAARAGVAPGVRHLASTAGALRRPGARYDLVRLGIGIYGLSPFGDGTTSADLGLSPAMTLRARVAAVRRVSAGTGASYDFIWRAETDTTLVLVPIGYADGIPRLASGRADVWIAGRRRPIVGRIAMDQFIVDVGDDTVSVGDEVVVFGDPATGAPSADEWATAADTINYEVVTRIGPRVARTYPSA